MEEATPIVPMRMVLRLSALLFMEPAKSPNIANRIGNPPIERHRPGRFLSDGSPRRSDVMTGIPHMEPSQPVECGSKPLDVQFAFE